MMKAAGLALLGIMLGVFQPRIFADRHGRMQHTHWNAYMARQIDQLMADAKQKALRNRNHKRI